jgi:hypothetical protein
LLSFVKDRSGDFLDFLLFCNLDPQNIPTQTINFHEYLHFYGVRAMIQSKQIDSIVGGASPTENRARLILQDSENSVIETIGCHKNSLALSLLGLIQSVDATTDIAIDSAMAAD